MTQTSCWRMPNRAKARPWAGERDVALRHGVEGGLGHRPAQSDHEGQHHLGEEGAPQRRSRAAVDGDEPQRAQQQLLLASCRLRSRPTRTRPTMAPAPLPARTRPYQYRPTPCIRRSPKASMKVMKPVRPRTMHMAVSPSITSGLAIGCSRTQVLLACLGLARPGRSRAPGVGSSVHSSSARRPVSTGQPGAARRPRRRRPSWPGRARPETRRACRGSRRGPTRRSRPACRAGSAGR